MPSNAPIVLTDGTTPVTFSPDSSNATHVVLQDLGEVKLANRQLLHFDRPSVSEKAVVRRSIRLNVPFEAADPATGGVITKVMSAKTEFVFPSDSTVAQRTRLRKLIAAALGSTAAVAAVDNPEWFW